MPFSSIPLVTANHPCNLCGSHEAFVLSERDRDGAALRTVISLKSGLVWTDPRPTAEELSAYYGQLYRVSYKGAWRPKPKHAFRAGRVARERFESLQTWIGSGRRFLDLGAGGGEFVYLLTKLGRDATGIEPNEAYARWARDELHLPVQAGMWNACSLPDDEFDVVTLFHVLEHLEDPLATLRQARRWLRTDGVVVVEVPNVEATCISPRRRFHFAHLYNFNAPALEALGRKAGFHVEHTRLSRDSGNLTVVLRKAEVSSEVSGEIPGNCARVLAALAAHTPLDHALSPQNWIRPVKKFARTCHETIVTLRRSANAPALLDHAIASRAAAAHAQQVA